VKEKIMLAPNIISAEDLFRPRTRIDSDGTVEGYASLFGEVDAARDMMMPGAFRETLRLRGVRRIPMLFQHDPAEPVGVWLELREDHRGLYARGRLIPEVARARELYALVASGAVDGLSIGFRTVKGRVDPRSRIRKIDQVELWEISIVTFPLLAGARVRAVKGNGAQHDAAERLFRRHPRLSFARARAEREWTSVWQGDTPAGAPDMPSLAPIRAPSAKRLESVHARRQSPPRRDRIRGWISDEPVRSAGDLKRVFAMPTR
jgi:HK97 family phage prohead protease